MKKLISTLIFVLTLVTAPAVSADYVGVTPQPSEVITVTKRVQDPANNEFKKNLTVSDTHLLPSNEVLFRIEIKNVAQRELRNVTVTDTLPNSLEFVSSSENFSRNGQTLSLTLDRLNSGETRFVDVRARVKTADLLPADQLNCNDKNFVEVKAENVTRQDSAFFCFENRVLGVTTELPKTGPETAGLVLLGSTGLLGAAYAFYRKSRKLQEESI